MRSASRSNQERGKKVLIIEDDAALQTALAEALSLEGFVVERASEGIAGFAKAQKFHPDLVLLDLILPGQSGFEILGKLKSDPATRRTPVMVLTNLGSAEDIEKALRLGAINFLVKANYKIEEVIERAHQALRSTMPVNA